MCFKLREIHEALIVPPYKSGQSTESWPSRGPASKRGNHFNFHQRILGQPCHLHRRARRRSGREVPPVNFVHRRKIVHVLQEYGGFHHVVKIRCRRFQNRFDIFHHSLGLLRRVRSGHLRSRRIKRHLPGNKQKTVGAHSLRIRPDRFWSAVGKHDFFHGVVSLEAAFWSAEVFSYRARKSVGTPGCFIHSRTNSAVFPCASWSNAAIRSSRSKPPLRRAYSMWRIALRNTSL